MKDRLVEYPNRFQLQEVEPGVYEVLPEPGSIMEEGTPINKATLLSDPMSARYGLTDGTPTEAFGQAVQILTATVSAGGWSSSPTAAGWYENRVSVAGMKAVYNPLLDLVITSAALAEDERAAFGLIMEAETFDGYVIFRVLDVPDISFNVRFVGV